MKNLFLIKININRAGIFPLSIFMKHTYFSHIIPVAVMEMPSNINI